MPEMGNAEEAPVEDCLSSQRDGAEISAVFQLIQDRAKQERKERTDAEIVSALVGEQDGSSKVKPWKRHLSNPWRQSSAPLPGHKQVVFPAVAGAA